MAEEENKPNPVGRPRNIDSPEQLYMLFRKYMIWCKENPRIKQDFVGKDGDEIERKLERPLSWVGFEAYLYERLIISDLGNYERNTDGSYKEFLPIIRAIKTFIEQDQFEGAAVGLYKENIIARKLGLADKQESRQVDKDGKDLPAPGQILIMQAKDDDDDHLEIKEGEE